jgi:outer membrane protein OmpA-like peptidoglycan-associated protein
MMKHFLFSIIMGLSFLLIQQNANGQFLKRLKQEVKNRAETHVINDAGNVTDKAITKTEVAATSPKKEPGNQQQSEQQNSVVQPNSSTPSEVTATASTGTTGLINNIGDYKNYDFVPGDKVIFETDFINQKDAELPARLGTLHGSAEIQTYKENKVLHINKGDNVCIIPMIDSANYLPAQFTIEFDFLYKDPNPTTFNQIEVNFFKPDKNNDYMISNYGDYHFLIYEAGYIDFGKSIQGKQLSSSLSDDLKVPYKWHHVAIYVHDNIGKAYIDQYRVAASNMMMKGASKLAIKTNGRMEYLIKNLRIAGGGSDAYHKIMTEGKLVTHGIHFASGKADILPESMGTINEVYNILKNHADLKLEIDGYTDNDGSADLNLKLSQQRADAVKAQLRGLGIDDARLTTKGFGEQKPVASNDTPEGKANNRRVEFVKK